MTKTHGNRRHYQVLLDPYRADLLEHLAADAGMRPAAYARELLYAAVRRSTTVVEYGLAEARDQALRREGIRNQVRGRVGP